MALITRKYKRLIPDVSVAELKNKETGKIFYRHRWVAKGKSNSSNGTQEFKDYTTRKFKTFDLFKAYIIKEFGYE